MSLEAQNLSFHYPHRNQKFLWKDLSLTLHPGDRLGLTGPSGCGKTTLCKLLAGYLKPNQGSIEVDGLPLSQYKGSCPVQLIGQHPETMLDPLLPLKRSLEEAGPVDPVLLEALHIQPNWLGRYPQELSGGELQRFCIARALSAAPRYLLCDEITAMLDFITQAQIWEFLLQEARRRNLGLLIVSHSIPLLERVCTHVKTLSSD